MEKNETKKFRKISRFGNSLRSSKDHCFFCSCKLDNYSRTVDHLVPQSKGGIRSNDNKVFACKKCNQLKANCDPFEFKAVLEKMITFELMSSRERVGFLKKVLINVDKLIENRKDVRVRPTKKELPSS